MRTSPFIAASISCKEEGRVGGGGTGEQDEATSNNLYGESFELLIEVSIIASSIIDRDRRRLGFGIPGLVLLLTMVKRGVVGGGGGRRRGSCIRRVSSRSISASSRL